MARVLVPTTEVTPAKATADTAITGADNDLRFTAQRGGSWGNAIRVQYIDPGTPSAVLSIDVDGFDVTVNLATDSGSAIITTANEIAAKLAVDSFASRLLAAEAAPGNTGAGVVDAMSFVTLAGGEYGVTSPAGTAADATNDHYLTGNEGTTELEVTNATGSSRTVTVHYAALADVPGEPEVVTVPDGTTRVLGPFAPLKFNQNAAGDVYFDPSASSASLTFRARKVTKAS